jgi:hypothetical protein
VHGTPLQNKEHQLSNPETARRSIYSPRRPKCNETVASVELMLKNLGSQVDTKAIIQKIEDAIKSIILPLQIRADKLSNAIEPTFEKLNAASERAAQLWPQRIWTTVLTAGVIIGSSVAILGISAAYWQMKHHFDKTLADEIRAEKYTLKNNMEAFQQLATAAASVCREVVLGLIEAGELPKIWHLSPDDIMGSCPLSSTGSK